MFLYRFLYDDFGCPKEIEVAQRGFSVLTNPYVNKGSAFDPEERRLLGLEGLLPPAVRTLEDQVAAAHRIVLDKDSDLERFVYLRSLFDRNVTLTHALIARDIEYFMPIIYTPTVGLACQNYSSMYRQAQGLFFYPGNIDQAEEILRRYAPEEVRVAVVTDNQGILGIGDQGVGGIAICVGKLMLYTQGAGIAPWHCLPICLDVGTDNQALLEDPLYLGWRHPRLKGEEYIAFVQQFARAFKAVYPHALCQWEDFSKQNAFAIRDAYLHDLISFNDDIQGTGAVTLAAILTAMKIKGEPLGAQRFLIYGAGAGGVGIAEQILTALEEEGLSPKEARARLFVLDSRGLITTERPRLEAYKRKFAWRPEDLPWLSTPEDLQLGQVVQKARITVLIGVSGQAGAFDQAIVQTILKYTPRPVILPLSNPTEKAEAHPADLYSWTQGQVLVATGSPFPPVRYQGQEIRVGQCNNVFVFPGVGLGVLASGAREVLPSFFTAAAQAVSEMVSPKDLRKGILMPPVTDLKEVTLAVAKAVGEVAISRGVSGLCVHSRFQHENDPERLALLVEKMRWLPRYLPIKAV